MLHEETPTMTGPTSHDRPVYYVIYQDVHDEQRFESYVDAVMPAIARHDGVLVAAGTPSFTEGALPFGRSVIFRYSSRMSLETFLNSDEYAAIRKLREGAADWASAIVPAAE